jgi:hypothetical protein
VAAAGWQQESGCTAYATTRREGARGSCSPGGWGRAGLSSSAGVMAHCSRSGRPVRDWRPTPSSWSKGRKGGGTGSSTATGKCTQGWIRFNRSQCCGPGPGRAANRATNHCFGVGEWSGGFSVCVKGEGGESAGAIYPAGRTAHLLLGAAVGQDAALQPDAVTWRRARDCACAPPTGGGRSFGSRDQRRWFVCRVPNGITTYYFPGQLADGVPTRPALWTYPGGAHCGYYRGMAAMSGAQRAFIAGSRRLGRSDPCPDG